MAARIVHFGVDSCHRLWVLKNAGYSVDDCQSVVQLRAALQSGTHADAVAFTESERLAPDKVVEVTRAHSSAPLILFRETRIDCVESVFDLVVPVLEPPETWLMEIAALIAKGQAIRASSEALVRRAIVLRQEVAAVCRRTREERKQRSLRERLKPNDPWDSVRGKPEPPREG